MNVLDNYPRPWRVDTTRKQRRTGGGYNYHIRAANDNYVVENVHGGISTATIIVEGVNEREERDRLRTQLAETEQRAEMVEADRNHLRGMLDMMPEYLEYWLNNNTFSEPALTLSEWYSERG